MPHQRELLEELPLVSRRAPSESAQRRFVQTIARDAWDGLSYAHQCHLISEGVVHIVGRPPVAPHGITGIDDERFFNLVNINSARECRGMSNECTEKLSEHRLIMS